MPLQRHTSSPNENFTIQSFFDALRNQGILIGALCNRCGWKMLPPRPVCSKCFSTELRRLQLPKSGKVISFSEVHVSNAAFSRFVPYIVAIVDFDGIRIPGMIKNANIKNLTVGAPVEVRTKALSKISEADRLSQDGPEYWFELAREYNL